VNYIQKQNLQDLCSTVTVNKHTYYQRPKKLLLFWKYFNFWQWLIEYSVVLF